MARPKGGLNCRLVAILRIDISGNNDKLTEPFLIEPFLIAGKIKIVCGWELVTRWLCLAALFTAVEPAGVWRYGRRRRAQPCNGRME